MKELYEDVAFVVYPVSDILRSKAFFSGVLELTETADWGEWVEYDIGHGTLAITNTYSHLKPGANGAILAIEVSDIDKMHEALKRKIVNLVTEAFDMPGCKNISIKDPDGNKLILHQRKDK